MYIVCAFSVKQRAKSIVGNGYVLVKLNAQTSHRPWIIQGKWWQDPLASGVSLNHGKVCNKLGHGHTSSTPAALNSQPHNQPCKCQLTQADWNCLDRPTERSQLKNWAVYVWFTFFQWWSCYKLKVNARERRSHYQTALGCKQVGWESLWWKHSMM